MMFQAKDTTNNRLIFVAVKEITLQNALKDPGVRGLASVDKVRYRLLSLWKSLAFTRSADGLITVIPRLFRYHSSISSDTLIHILPSYIFFLALLPAFPSYSHIIYLRLPGHSLLAIRPSHSRHLLPIYIH